MRELPAIDATASDPLLSCAPQADVLIDRIQFGLDVALPHLLVDEAEGFCARLYQAGIIKAAPKPGQCLKNKLAVLFVVPDLPEGGEMTITGEIFLSADDAGRLRITNRSRLRPGLLRALRSQLEDPGEPATGGATNLVGAHGDDWTYLLGQELANLRNGIDALVAELAEAAGLPSAQLRGRLWVQQCEIYRDLPDPVQAAETIVQDLAQRSLMGGAQQTIRSIQDHEGDRLVVRWRPSTHTAPGRKAYAKRADLLRTEIELPDRETVRALLATAPSPMPREDNLSGQTAAAVVAALAEAAVPLLDEMWQTVNELYEVYPRCGTEFLLGLMPLLRLAAPEPRPAGAAGRPTGEATPRQARRALETLLWSGRCATTTRETPEKLRDALVEMERAGLLRRLDNRPTVFGLRPEFEQARQALRAARRRDDRLDEHLET
ncbi:hypothetical protein [Teichococcus aestuarii]|uniref:Uncharacterized protein n=1 Tax=Teichococcus aestuarii TaxID=568898 RepID=A0A2U1V552_9PROT|nr:hypothetical protein [Pseudoroseomonas aestuarii]PWC29026.1 hypothetical protein CR165_10580 [Pseudoroseomonas aestuarii]